MRRMTAFGETNSKDSKMWRILTALSYLSIRKLINGMHSYFVLELLA